MSDSIERSVAETTPTASELSWPNGLPIAATGSPTTTRLESPSGTGETAWSSGSTLTSPVSLKRSQPTIEPGIRSPSAKTT